MFTTQMDLYGTPLPECKGKWRKAAAYLCKPECKTALMVCVSAAPLGLLFGGENVIRDSSACCVFSMAYLGMQWVEDRQTFSRVDYFGDKASALAIETKPEIMPPPSWGKYKNTAERLKIKAMLNLLIGPMAAVALCGSLFGLGSFSQEKITASGMAYLALQLATGVVGYANGVYRWNKVAKGEWEIVDKPALKEPVPVLDKVKNVLTAPVPAPSSNLG